MIKSQSYRARRNDLEVIPGSMEEQFQKIYDYCLELDRTNLGFTILMKLNEEIRFQRFYVL